MSNVDVNGVDCVVRVYLEEVIVRLRAGVESSDSDKERLEQRIKAMDEQFRHDKQQFEVCIIIACENAPVESYFSLRAADVSNVSVVGA